MRSSSTRISSGSRQRSNRGTKDEDDDRLAFGVAAEKVRAATAGIVAPRAFGKGGDALTPWRQAKRRSSNARSSRHQDLRLSGSQWAGTQTTRSPTCSKCAGTHTSARVVGRALDVWAVPVTNLIRASGVGTPDHSGVNGWSEPAGLGGRATTVALGRPTGGEGKQDSYCPLLITVVAGNR